MNIINPMTLLIVPILGSIVILIFPHLPKVEAETKELQTLSIIRQNIRTAQEQSKRSPVRDAIKMIAIFTSLLNFIFSMFLWVGFDSSYIGYQFVSTVSPLGLDFIQFNLGIDGISLFFVLLTTFITPIALLSSHNDIEKNLKFYLVSMLLLETLQIAVFVVLDLLLFYIFFESVLIPLFFIIGVWGASAAKVRAAFLLFLYTLFGSLFMLLAIIQIYNYLGATDFALLSVTEISLEYQKLLWLKPLCQQQGSDQYLTLNLVLTLASSQRVIKFSTSTLVSSNCAIPSINRSSSLDKNKKDLVNCCKTIVPFGMYLSSNIHYKPYNYNIKYLMKLPVELESLITRSFNFGRTFD